MSPEPSTLPVNDHPGGVCIEACQKGVRWMTAATTATASTQTGSERSHDETIPVTRDPSTPRLAPAYVNEGPISHSIARESAAF